MTSVASMFSDAKTKFQVGVAATAVAAAATITPVVAEANPYTPAPLAPISSLIGSDIALAPASALAADEWGGWFWVGHNRNEGNGGPAYRDVVVFTPMALIPGFLKPIYEFLTGWVNFQACAFGVSLRVGPYLRTSITVGKGC